MAKELKKMIREAFNMAYTKHKKNLHENADSLKAKMSSGDVYKAENAFREIIANPNMAAKYAWTPQGSANGALNTKQFNLLVELLFEGTDLATKRLIFMTMYSDKNPALVNAIKAKLMGLKGTYVTPEEAMQAIETGWNEMFLGEKGKRADKEKKSFINAASEYNPLESSNFGAFLITRLLNASSNALRDSFGAEKPLSLDAPLPSTGKTREVGDAEDFGSDVIEDPETHDVVKDIGGGFEEPDIEDNGSAINIADDEGQGEENDIESGHETLGNKIAGSIEDKTPAELHAEKMIDILTGSLREAIEDFKKYKKVSPAQIKGFAALEHILNTGESPSIAAAGAITDLKDNRDFMNTVDRYLFENGFLNSRGKVESFKNIKLKYLAQLVKYKMSGDIKTLSPDLKESKIWFINELVLERFVETNMEKIMERVYNRLSIKLL